MTLDPIAQSNFTRVSQSSAIEVKGPGAKRQQSATTAISRRQCFESALQLGAEAERQLSARNPRRSLRWLATHVFHTHRSSLWRAWAIYRLVQAFPLLQALTHVGIGHFSVVLALPADLGVALLLTAEEKGWSREKLRRIAAGYGAEAAPSLFKAELD